jgi:hypothetical protein
MSDHPVIVRFDHGAIEEVIPEEGTYPAFVYSVKERVSEKGNATIHIVYKVRDVDPAWERVNEYFVVSSPSTRALAISQQRLRSLCRACGLDPCEGDEIDLTQLIGVAVDLRLGHETFDGRKRLRVLTHRGHK